MLETSLDPGQLNKAKHRAPERLATVLISLPLQDEIMTHCQKTTVCFDAFFLNDNFLQLFLMHVFAVVVSDVSLFLSKAVTSRFH